MIKAPTAAIQHYQHKDPNGAIRPDAYQWIRQPLVNETRSEMTTEQKIVIDYLTAENDYTTQVLQHNNDLQENLYKEMIARLAPDDNSVPVLKSGYYYKTQYYSGLEYPQYQRSKHFEGPYDSYLDTNRLAEDHAYYKVGGIAVSPDDSMIAFTQDVIGRRNYTVHLKSIYEDKITNLNVGDTTGSIMWGTADTLYYIKKDEALRPYQIWRYYVATGKSELLYQEHDELYRVFLTKTKDRKYILLGIASSLTTEYHYIEAGDSTNTFTLFARRQHSIEYYPTHFEGKWYIRTNCDGAENFKIMTCPVRQTDRANWSTYLPYESSTYTTSLDVHKDFLIRSVRINGQTEVVFTNWSTKTDKVVHLDEESYMISQGANYEIDATAYRLRYTSMTTPVSTLELNLSTWELVTLKEQIVLGDFDKSNYRSRRITAIGNDGTNVPISIIYHKAYPDHDKQPLLLYAYGAYGYSIDPYFSSARLSLLDRGFTFAIAHVRGGTDFGHQWYEQGKFLQKKNTFYDFIACGRYLQDNGWCDSRQLYAMGGSAGGLLMGAIINMAPNMWKGVIAAVPFVDVLSTMLDDSIPLTVGEYEEWGNPNIDEYYHYIKSYSPYDNVKAQDYPHLLVTSGYYDSQVQYWEPTKWVAKLREHKTDNNRLLLHTNMEAGHGGASGRYQMYKETAMEYAFLLDLAGLSDPT